MKTYKFLNITVALLLVFLISGCSETFLEREPSGDITAQQLKEASAVNPDISKAMVSGIISLTFQHGTGGTTGHDDFGQKSIDIVTDMMSGDMTLGAKTYGWFSGVYELKQMERTNTRTIMNWTYYYSIIKSANEVIDGLGGNDVAITDLTDENKAYMGQARTLRAYAYFYLANLFQHPYDETKAQPTIPIYDTQLTLEASPLRSAQEVYDLIIGDLEYAVTALDGFGRGNKSEINQDVARGFLAYAYLSTGDNAKAAATAGAVIDGGNFPLMTADEVVNSGFNNISIPGWMWAIDLTVDNSPALPTFWGMVDIFTYSYAGVGDHKGMDEGLYAQIPETDVRKTQFVNAFGDGGLLPIGKFYDNGRTVFGNRTWDNDEVYMRVAEMYLIKAEALARSGDNDGAIETLAVLLAERDPDSIDRITGLSGQALLNEIYLQWRIEMWGEGKSYLAMKRFKATVTRGANHLDYVGEPYNYNDDRMIFEIPEDEINNNPLIEFEKSIDLQYNN